MTGRRSRPARRLLSAIAASIAVASGLALAPAWAQPDASPAFDFYVLALSWSPGFCASAGQGRAFDQCAPGRRLGFVVHGLWPQNERGYPTECGPRRMPSRIALEEAENVYPDLGLARHQWHKHGSCSGKDPAGYFRDVRRAWERVRIPERFGAPVTDEVTTPSDLERAFVEVNPGLRPEMIAVVCRRTVLQEVRICLDKDLRGFRRCPEVDRNGCRIGDLLVKAAR